MRKWIRAATATTLACVVAAASTSKSAAAEGKPPPGTPTRAAPGGAGIPSPTNADPISKCRAIVEPLVDAAEDGHFYDGTTWTEVKRQTASTRRAVAFAMSEAALSDAELARRPLFSRDKKVAYRALEAPVPVDLGKACPKLYRRTYRLPTLYELTLAQVFTDFRRGKLDPDDVIDRDDRGERGFPRRACTDEDPDAPALELALQKALRCVPDTFDAPTNTTTLDTKFPNVCGVLLTSRLCEHASYRSDLRVALATDLLQHIVDDLDGRPTQHLLGRLSDLLRTIPEELQRPDSDTFRRLAKGIVVAIDDDAVDEWNRNPTKSLRVVAVATVAACHLAQRERDLERLEDCPLATVASTLGNAGADVLASELFAGRPRRGDPMSTAYQRLDHALAAAIHVVRGVRPQKEEALTQLHRLLRSVKTADDREVFAIAATSSYFTVVEKDAVRALALASTRSLTMDRAKQVRLIEHSRADRLELGFGLRALAGVQFGRGAAFAGPVNLPFGIAYQSSRSPGLYLDATIFDPGQYLSWNQYRRVEIREPTPFDGLAPSASIGIRFLPHQPFVVAATGGVARLASGEETGYAALTLGTFVKLRDLSGSE